MTLTLTADDVTHAQAYHLTRYDAETVLAALAAWTAIEAEYTAVVSEAYALLTPDQMGFVPEAQRALRDALVDANCNGPTLSHAATYSSELYPVRQWETATRRLRRYVKHIRQETARLQSAA